MAYVYSLLKFQTSEGVGGSFDLSFSLASYVLCNNGSSEKEPLSFSYQCVYSFNGSNNSEFIAKYTLGSKWNLYKSLPYYLPRSEIPYYLAKDYLITKVVQDIEIDGYFSNEVELETMKVYKIKKDSAPATLMSIAGIRLYNRIDYSVDGDIQDYNPKLICGDRFIIVPVWYISNLMSFSAVSMLGNKLIFGRVAGGGNYISTTGIGIIDTLNAQTYILSEFDYYTLSSQHVSVLTEYLSSKYKDVDYVFVPTTTYINDPSRKIFFNFDLQNISLINENELHIYLRSIPHLVYDGMYLSFKNTGFLNINLTLTSGLSDNNTCIGSINKKGSFYFKGAGLNPNFTITYSAEVFYHYVYTFTDNQWQLVKKESIVNQLSIGDYDSFPMFDSFYEDTPLLDVFNSVSSDTVVYLGAIPKVEQDFCYLWQPSFDSSKIVPKGKPIPFNMMTLDLSQIPSNYKFTHKGNTYIVYSRVSRKIFGFHNEFLLTNTINAIYPDWITKGYPYEYTIAKIENNQIVSKLPEGYYILEENGFTRTIPKSFVPIVKVNYFNSDYAPYKYGIGGRYFDLDLNIVDDEEVETMWNLLLSYSNGSNPYNISLFYVEPDLFMLFDGTDLIIYRHGKIYKIPNSELLIDNIIYGNNSGIVKRYFALPLLFVIDYYEDTLLLYNGRYYLHYINFKDNNYELHTCHIEQEKYNIYDIVLNDKGFKRVVSSVPNYASSFEYSFNLFNFDLRVCYFRFTCGIYTLNFHNNIAFIFKEGYTNIKNLYSFDGFFNSYFMSYAINFGNILIFDKYKLRMHDSIPISLHVLGGN